jgi:quercetin dioxygenase-like cupin family protein
MTSQAPGLTGTHRIWRGAGRNETGAAGLVFEVIEFDPGTKHILHRHPNCEQFMYLVAGSAKALTRDGNVALKAGDGIFIPRNEWHGLLNDGDDVVHLVHVYGGVGSLDEGGYEEAPIGPTSSLE